MKMETKVNGMTFVNKHPLFAELRPSGLLHLVPDKTNKYDPMAVEVYMPHPDGKSDPVRIGFLPATVKGSPELEAKNKELQEWVHAHHQEAICVVLKYSYFDKDIGFNEDHEGKLQSCAVYVTDSIEDARAYYKKWKAAQDHIYGNSDEPKDEIEVTSTHYVKGKKKYRRITDLLSCYEPDGKTGFDRIIEWAIKTGLAGVDANDKAGMTHDELAKEIHDKYRTAFEATGDDGTAKHEAIENFCREMMAGGKKTDKRVIELFDATPVGFQNFWHKFNPRVLGVETTVFNDELGLAGTYDVKLEIVEKGKALKVIGDWKRSKAVRKKHKTQAGFYTVMEDGDEGWVIALGAKTKQGYSLNRQTAEECNAQFDKIDLIKQLQDME